MARKKKASAKPASAPDNQLAAAVAASAQKIWLAGLGAFARAKDEGDKMFDVLVEQGRKLRERSQSAADDAMKTVRAQTEATVANAQGRWDKLEQVFEDRVSRALARLGVYTSSDVERLSERVNELSEAVNALLKAQGIRRKPPASPTQRMVKGAVRNATRTAARTVSGATDRAATHRQGPGSRLAQDA